MEINLSEIILGIITLIAGGGWWVSYRAAKRKADGEATQSEAEGWAKMQEVYQDHIKDMSEITEQVRKERDHEIKRNETLKHEYEEIRDKYIAMEDQILELRREIARMGRKLELVLPFSCGVAACQNRKRVNLDTDIEQD